MATLHKEIHIEARPEAIWEAARDVGALHRRLVPGFVADTKLEGAARIVTFEAPLPFEGVRLVKSFEISASSLAAFTLGIYESPMP